VVTAFFNGDQGSKEAAESLAQAVANAK
jgi:hypothetical protein